MPIEALTTEAEELSSYKVTCAFTDDDGDAVIPNLIKWSLIDEDGNIINSRSWVSVETPAASTEVALYDKDLQIKVTEAIQEAVVRRFVVYAEYDSDLGSNLPLYGSCRITIRNLVRTSSSSSSSSSSSGA